MSKMNPYIYSSMNNFATFLIFLSAFINTSSILLYIFDYISLDDNEYLFLTSLTVFLVAIFTIFLFRQGI